MHFYVKSQIHYTRVLFQRQIQIQMCECTFVLENSVGQVFSDVFLLGMRIVLLTLLMIYLSSL
jgi:hypothetical protein